MSAKYEFIDAQKAQYAIVKMCRWLGVSTSGFYEWRDRPASATARRRERLAALIQWIYDDSPRVGLSRAPPCRAGKPPSAPSPWPTPTASPVTSRDGLSSVMAIPPAAPEESTWSARSAARTNDVDTDKRWKTINSGGNQHH